MPPEREIGPLGNEGTDMVMRIPIKQYIDDLMKEVRDGFKDLREALASKADKSVVEDHARRIADLERSRPSKEYGEQLLGEHRQLKLDVAELKTTAVTQEVLGSRDKEFRRLLWGIFATVIGGVVVGVVLSLHPHIVF